MTATASAPDAPPIETGQAFRVEQHGVDFIPEAERWATPRDLFGMWAGASVNVEYFFYGAILMTVFGFTFLQVISLIVIGNLSFVLLGLCSLQGPQAGTTTFGVNRAPFGVEGSRGVAGLNWLTQIGFEAEGLILIVGAGLALATLAGVHPGTGLKVGLILGAVGLQVVLPVLGHATIVKTLRWLIVPFIVIFGVLLGFTAGHAHTRAVAHGAGWATYLVGLAFTITLSGLGWTENGNDYSRYLPATASRRAIVGWVFLGTALPEMVIMAVGALVATFLSGGWGGADAFDPLLHQHAVPTWFVVVFCLASVLQLFAINSLDLYSSGVSLQAVGLRVRRWQAVLIDGAVAGTITGYAIFSSSFSAYLQDFVDLVIIWIAPWCAIYLVDWVLRRTRYVPQELQRQGPAGLYWSGRGGVRWAAVAAQLLGMVAAISALASPPPPLNLQRWMNPLSVHTGGADFSIFLGMGVGAVAYLLLARPGVRRQAAAQERLLAGAVGVGA